MLKRKRKGRGKGRGCGIRGNIACHTNKYLKSARGTHCVTNFRQDCQGLPAGLSVCLPSVCLSLSLSVACLSPSPSLSLPLLASLSAWQVLLLLLLLNQLRRASISLVLPFPHFLPVVAFNLISFGRFVAFIEQCVSHFPCSAHSPYSPHPPQLNSTSCIALASFRAIYA